MMKIEREFSFGMDVGERGNWKNFAYIERKFREGGKLLIGLKALFRREEKRLTKNLKSSFKILIKIL